MNGFQQARLAWRLLRDPRVAGWTKAVAPAIALAYVILPIDLVPDFILGLGQLDDLSVIGVAIFAMTKLLPRLAPRAIVAEHLDVIFGRERDNGDPRRTTETVVDTSYRVVDGKQAGQQRNNQRTGWGTRT